MTSTGIDEKFMSEALAERVPPRRWARCRSVP